jgi:Flp pilus assembly protein TadG
VTHQMRGQTRETRPRERGQALAIFAILLLALAGMGGLLLDGGMGWVNHQQAQVAADMSALAAMKAMADPANSTWAARRTAAASAATAMAAKNGFGDGQAKCGGASTPGVVVNSPPSGGPNAGNEVYVEVIVARPMQTALSHLLGQGCWLVSARAVARVVAQTGEAAGAPYPALLAGYTGTDCNARKAAWDNSGSFTINGDVISNGGVKDSSSGTVVNGSVNYVDNPPNVCGTTTLSKPGWTSTPTTTTTAYPVTYTFDTVNRRITNDKTGATSACTYFWSGGVNLGDGPWWVGGSKNSQQLMPGVYCATGDIGLSSKAVGSVTFVSGGKITISAGDPTNLSAHWDSLLLYSTKGDYKTVVINISASSMSWQGLVFAPNGQAQVSGGKDVGSPSAIWGLTVHTSGTGWLLQSDGLGTSGGPGVTTYTIGTLVE